MHGFRGIRPKSTQNQVQSIAKVLVAAVQPMLATYAENSTRIPAYVNGKILSGVLNGQSNDL